MRAAPIACVSMNSFGPRKARKSASARHPAGGCSGRKSIYALVSVQLLIAGCASAPGPGPAARVEAGAAASSRAADETLKMVGKPYRYGGSTPTGGFDCSGLVQFGFRQAGVRVPRTTENQLRASTRVRRSELRRGDLLFFDQEGNKNSHVGIYLGKGRFVHAPSSGKHVRTDRLDATYWKRHLSEARRF